MRLILGLAPLHNPLSDKMSQDKIKHWWGGNCLDREARCFDHDLAGGAITVAGQAQYGTDAPVAACSMDIEPLTVVGQFNGLAGAELRREGPERVESRLRHRVSSLRF